MSAKGIERMLAKAGVPEGTSAPYLTTARAMFAAIAWKSLQRIPEGPEAEELAQNARRFCDQYWSVYRIQDNTRMTILGQHSVTRSADGALQRRQGMAFVGGGQYLPSIRRRGPATHLMERDVAEVEAIADDIAAAACEALREDMDGVTIRRSMDGRFTRWGGLTIEVVVEGHAWRAVSWTGVELFNKSMDDLLHEVGYAPPRLDAARRNRDRLLRERPEITKGLTDIAERSMLPISFHVAPYPDSDSHAHDGIIVLSGYGPGGRTATQTLGCVGGNNTLDTLSRRIDDAIAEQWKLHAMYGPAPGSSPGPWHIDLVSARLLLEAGDGEVALARAVTSGSARTDNDLALRIAGRHQLMGKHALGENVMWNGNELRIVGQQLPDTVAGTLRGKPIEAVVDAPGLKGGGIITSIRHDFYRNQPRLNIKVKPTMIKLDMGAGDNA